jgi:hypothetical protein
VTGNSTDQLTCIVGEDDMTGVVPPTVGAPELAWSADTEPDEPQRQPWRLVYRRAAMLILGATAVAGMIGLIGWASKPVGLSTPLEMPPTTTVAPAAQPSMVPAQPAPPSTVTAAPPAISAAQETPPSTAPLTFTTAADQAFLDRQVADGWFITDPQQMLRTAHEVCRRFKLGEDVSQVYQDLAVATGMSTAAARSFTSNVLLTYDC